MYDVNGFLQNDKKGCLDISVDNFLKVVNAKTKSVG